MPGKYDVSRMSPEEVDRINWFTSIPPLSTDPVQDEVNRQGRQRIWNDMSPAARQIIEQAIRDDAVDTLKNETQRYLDNPTEYMATPTPEPTQAPPERYVAPSGPVNTPTPTAPQNTPTPTAPRATRTPTPNAGVAPGPSQGTPTPTPSAPGIVERISNWWNAPKTPAATTPSPAAPAAPPAPPAPPKMPESPGPVPSGVSMTGDITTNEGTGEVLKYIQQNLMSVEAQMTENERRHTELQNVTDTSKLSPSDAQFITNYDKIQAALTKDKERFSAQWVTLVNHASTLAAKTVPRGPSQQELNKYSAEAEQARASAEKLRADVEEMKAKRAKADDPNSIENQTLAANLKVAKVQLDEAENRARANERIAVAVASRFAGEIDDAQFENIVSNTVATTQEAIAWAAHKAQVSQRAEDHAFAVQQWEESTRRWNAEQEQRAADRTAAEQARKDQLSIAQQGLDLQKQSAALAERQAQAQEAARRAQQMQAYASLESDRQAKAAQAQAQFEQTGVATPGRLQNLAAMRAPLPAAQAAGMLGMDVNSPEFQGIYSMYSNVTGGGATPSTITMPPVMNAPTTIGAALSQPPAPTQPTQPSVDRNDPRWQRYYQDAILQQNATGSRSTQAQIQQAASDEATRLLTNMNSGR